MSACDGTFGTSACGLMVGGAAAALGCSEHAPKARAATAASSTRLIIVLSTALTQQDCWRIDRPEGRSHRERRDARGPAPVWGWDFTPRGLRHFERLTVGQTSPRRYLGGDS